VVIAKQAGNAVWTNLHVPRFVESIGVGGHAIAIAKKGHIQRAAEDPFVGAEPLEAFLGGDGEGLIRDRTFGGPQSRGLHAKHSFVVAAGTLQLLARIFRTAVGASRERRAGIGYARDIGIADQRKDGVVERSRADLDLSALSCVTINREHQAEELELFFSQCGFVIFRVVLPFRG
jgi:hypothetical protein